MKIKMFSSIALSLALFTAPFMLSAETLDRVQINGIDQNMAFGIDRECHHHHSSSHSHSSSYSHSHSHSHHKDFTVKDFAGDWVLTVESIGGVSGATAVGASLVIDAQLSFNKRGSGVFNYASGAIYTGVVGSVDFFTFSGGLSTITLEIIDPINGIGTLTIDVPSIGYTDTADFIILRSKFTGEAIRLVGHSTQANPDTAAIAKFTLQRQDE